MNESTDVRIAVLEVKVFSLENSLTETRNDLKEASNEVRALADEMREVASELRTTLTAAIAAASKPMENLWVGWKVLGNLAKFVLGSLALVGGLISIIKFAIGK